MLCMLSDHSDGFSEKVRAIDLVLCKIPMS